MSFTRDSDEQTGLIKFAKNTKLARAAGTLDAWFLNNWKQDLKNQGSNLGMVIAKQHFSQKQLTEEKELSQCQYDGMENRTIY